MNSHTRPSGFTLIETLVAIAILTIAIVAPFTAAQRSLVAANTARDQLIAASLAQEGLEYVREIRASDYLATPTSYDPLGGLDSSPNCLSPNLCVIDASQTFGSAAAVKQCTGGVCSTMPLYLSSAGLYNQQGDGTKTSFVRSITLTKSPGGAANVVRATVTVSWTTSNQAQTMSLSEDLYAWL